MRFRHLRYFLVVAEEKNFSRASEKVHIDPSPLARAIRDLEGQIGTRLIHRSRGRIQLTQAGEVFREDARRVLALFEDARKHARSAAHGFRGRLRIGLADGLAQPRLIRLLVRFREEEPTIDVGIQQMTVSEMFTALTDERIDAGFTVDGEDVEGFRKEAIWTERPVLAIPTHHPLLTLAEIPLHEVLRHPLLLCHPEQWAGGSRIIGQWLGKYPDRPPTVTEYVAGHEMMMMLAAAGYGVGIGLETQCALYNQPDVIIRPLTSDVPGVTTFVVTGGPISPELERFIERGKKIGKTTTRNDQSSWRNQIP